MRRTAGTQRGLFGFGADVTALLGLMLAAGVVSGPAHGLLPVYLEHDLAWAPPAIAALTAIRLLPAALTAPVGGALADALGPQRALGIGLLSLPLIALAYLTPGAGLLAALILLSGLAEGLQSTGSQAYLVARATPATIGLASSVFYVGSTLGGALGNLAAGALLTGWGFAGLGAAGVLVGLLLLWPAAMLPGEPTRPARRAVGRGNLAAYRALVGHRPVRQVAALRFLSTCFWGAATLLWPLLIARLSGDPAVAALFGTVSLTLAVACQLVTGRVIDAIGPSRPALLLAALVPATALLAALTADSLPGFFAAGVLATCVAWSLSGAVMPLVRAVAPADRQGQTVGLLHLLWCLAMLSGALLAGWLLPIHPALPFVAVALLNLPAVPAALGVHHFLTNKR
jgi:MFS family permease